MRRLVALLRGLFWEHSQLWRRPARRLRRALLRGRREPGSLPRIEIDETPAPASRISHPAIAVHPGPGTDEDGLGRFLAGQTERSFVSSAEAGDPETPFCFVAEGDLGELPAVHLEALLLTAATEDLDWTVAAWAEPAAAQLCRPAGTARAGLTLLRLAAPGRDDRRPLRGKVLRHVTGEPHALAESAEAVPDGGDYFFDADAAREALVVHRLALLAETLADLPPIPGPRTVLFLLPFLAVGGAERQLLDLLEGFGERFRALVVTLEPHRPELGQTLDACRRITPHVYTLGDWLPRQACFGALCHLIRRYAVEALVSWNGTVELYDRAPELRRLFPELRLLHQIYNHEGGWIGHLGPRLLRTFDIHLAVNLRIAAVLERDFGVGADRITVVHPSVDVPILAAVDERRRRREARRRELGLPADALIAGTFVRMHPQKRPLDVLALARRCGDVHFLLVGGGPLDAEIDRELASRPLPNLTRLGLRDDVLSLYDAIDLALSTSSFEGLPVFLLEALARAVPCVTTAVGDVPLLLRDGGGVQVERPGDLAALAAGIESLRDPDRRAAEGARGRERVLRDFHLDRFRERYEAAIFPG